MRNLLILRDVMKSNVMKSLFFQLKIICITLVVIPLIVAGSAVAQNLTPPSPWGGKRMLKEFIKEEMVYPDAALKKKVEGTVVFSFVVNKDGSVSDLKITQSVSNDIDNEAIRIFRKILWNPATRIGKPVNYVTTFEIKFNIKKYKKMCKARGYTKINYPYEPVDKSDKIYSFSEVTRSPTPVFSSRDYNFSSFIANNLKYPEAAFKQAVSGVVKLQFVVEPSGRISNIVTKKALGAGCTEEAIRVVKLLRWNPGIHNTEAVRTFMTIEIAFNVADKTVKGKIPTPGQVY